MNMDKASVLRENLRRLQSYTGQGTPSEDDGMNERTSEDQDEETEEDQESIYSESSASELDNFDTLMGHRFEPTLENQVFLNQMYIFLLDVGTKMLTERLEENFKQQASLRGAVFVPTRKYYNISERPLSYSFFGFPYFTDEEGCPPPSNKDEYTLSNLGVEPLSYEYFPWSKVEAKLLTQAVEIQIRKAKAEQYLKEKKAIEDTLYTSSGPCTMSDVERRENEEKLEMLSVEISKTSMMTTVEIMNSSNFNLNWSAVAEALEFRKKRVKEFKNEIRKRSSEECLRHFMNVVHPSVTEKSFYKSQQERRIKPLLSRSSDWREFRYKFPNMSDVQLFREVRRIELEGQASMPPDDLKRLNEFCQKQGPMFYDQVADKLKELFPRYSKHQLRSLYNKKQLELGLIKKTTYYSQFEDLAIIEGFEKGHSAEKIASSLPHRTAPQITRRHSFLVENDWISHYKSESWTADQDYKLLYYGWRQFRGPGITPSLKLFPGKTIDEIKRRKVFLDYHKKRHAIDLFHNVPGGNVLEEYNLKKDVTLKYRAFRRQDFVKAFSGSRHKNFKRRIGSKFKLKTYARPYYVKSTGRTKLDTRAPKNFVSTLESRNAALLLTRYLHYLNVDVTLFIQKYNEDPDMTLLYDSARSEKHVPDAVKHHVAHLLSKGEFASSEEVREPGLTPPKYKDMPMNVNHPPSFPTLLLLRSILLHQKYLSDKKEGKWNEEPSEQKPKLAMKRSESLDRTLEIDQPKEMPELTEKPALTISAESSDVNRFEQALVCNRKQLASVGPLERTSNASARGMIKEQAHLSHDESRAILVERLKSILHWSFVMSSKL
ncbi:hypothetical protein QYM36_016455 [Artemia franciscana]|nr:hypothetical protein QYM36_016455 [Artemia franciscana]